ncbi:MAG: zinc metalloprotease HtpX [Desulfurococcaceae archaeon]
MLNSMPIILWPFGSLAAFVAIFIAYVLGLVLMFIAASKIAPSVARRLSGRLSLHASMALLGAVLVIGSLAAVALLVLMAGAVLGAGMAVGMAVTAAFFVLLGNALTYLISPFMINLMYGAREDPELQAVVNEVAAQAGFSRPPKAVVVGGPANAFAYGNFLSGRYVAVSSEMIRITNRDELKAVIGHELGHHKHRDNAIMLFIGLLPSLIYYMGLFLVQASFYARSASKREQGIGGGILLLLAGAAAIVVSFLVQILVLAFSRLREYYADAHGAQMAGARAMQRALAKLHLYYDYSPRAKDAVSSSKIRALFIYAFVNAVANPLWPYPPARPSRDLRNVDVDSVIDELRRMEVSGVSEILSTHPPIPKRIRFLDSLSGGPEHVIHVM